MMVSYFLTILHCKEMIRLRYDRPLAKFTVNIEFPVSVWVHWPADWTHPDSIGIIFVNTGTYRHPPPKKKPINMVVVGKWISIPTIHEQKSNFQYPYQQKRTHKANSKISASGNISVKLKNKQQKNIVKFHKFS